ncbi:hypothetical protein GCK32_018799, partial [Trichostrongylus colubriformis]
MVSAVALRIQQNYNLKDVSGLIEMAENIIHPKEFEGQPDHKKRIWFMDNGRICHDEETRNTLQKLVLWSTPIEFSDHCRKRCAGGVVDDAFLKQLKDERCQIIMEGLTIKDFNFDSSEQLKLFNTIEDIEGSLTIINSTGFKDLTFFESLIAITDYRVTHPLIRIARNPNLTSIEPLPRVELLYEKEDVDNVAVIETYSAINEKERKGLEEQGAIFRVHVKE